MRSAYNIYNKELAVGTQRKKKCKTAYFPDPAPPKHRRTPFGPGRGAPAAGAAGRITLEDAAEAARKTDPRKKFFRKKRKIF